MKKALASNLSVNAPISQTMSFQDLCHEEHVVNHPSLDKGKHELQDLNWLYTELLWSFIVHYIPN